MRLLIHTPPGRKPELYGVRTDQRIVRFWDTDHTTTRERLALMTEVWPGEVLAANFAPLNIDLIWYSPKGYGAYIYAGKPGRATLRRYGQGMRAGTIEEMISRIDPDNAHLLDLHPFEKP